MPRPLGATASRPSSASLRTCGGIGRDTEALDLWHQAHARGSGLAATRLGQRELEHDRPDAALKHFEAAVERGNPEGAWELLRRLGDDHPRARTLRLLAEDGDVVPALMHAAQQENERLAYTRAERLWRRADAGGDAHAAAMLAFLSDNRGDLDDAEAAYRRATHRGHHDAGFHLAKLLHRRGRTAEAEALLCTATDAQRERWDALRAQRRIEQGSPAAALEILPEAPTQPRSTILRAVALLASGRSAEALAQLEEAHPDAGDSGSAARVLTAAALLGSRGLPAALEALEAVGCEDPGIELLALRPARPLLEQARHVPAGALLLAHLTRLETGNPGRDDPAAAPVREAYEHAAGLGVAMAGGVGGRADAGARGTPSVSRPRCGGRLAGRAAGAGQVRARGRTP